ncbi:ABC transporter [Purpureocillium lilacinum]|uniref:ABC transporter n=1 Tax=Purpureocillium lilacinum TaxID=33203 RepID=A0A179HVR7_PURLI|nr:ABC transporter [Purpureocillium lilacinum]OAQ93982.1 ABC transporter [Purpureocillium lilacinum]PWI70219.1 ABC transporter with duplicated ATPase domain [Purpureocillium lilacinum]
MEPVFLASGVLVAGSFMTWKLLYGSGRHGVEQKVQPHRTFERKAKLDLDEELCQQYKSLYFKLHNLEQHNDVLPEAKKLLLSFFSDALKSENFRSEGDDGTSILSITDYSNKALDNFVHAQLDAATTEWQHYLARRKNGSPRELFDDAAEARQWLVQKAPHKLVDGAWLGHVHRATAPFAYRRVTKAAWQVLSEELGDGDLAKCHAYVYARLLEKVGSPVPAPTSANFVENTTVTDTGLWRSAVAQLLISLFPDEFLPEILGFNLHFEMLTLETLMAAKELREVGIDPYYFTLHVTIDNADTGHTAMASRIVADYLELISAEHGPAATQQAWKRVQAGFLMSKNVHHSYNDKLTERIVTIFTAKSIASHRIHDHCTMTLGGQSLSKWLDPTLFHRLDWQAKFLKCLRNAKPWIHKGNSSKSRLVRQLSWGGSMFGAFTDREVVVVKDWIDSLVPAGPETYQTFTGHLGTPESSERSSLPSAKDARSFADIFASMDEAIELDLPLAPLALDPSDINVGKLLPLWFAQAGLLDFAVSVPWYVADDVGCAIVRTLRAQYGFLPEPTGVDGVDEMRRDDSIDLIDIGNDLLCRHDPDCAQPSCMSDVLKRWPSPFAEAMLAAAQRPRELGWVLLGMAQAFTRLHDVVAASYTLLSSPKREALGKIAAREQEGLKACTDTISSGSPQDRDFRKGYQLGVKQIMSCLA